MNPFEVLKIPHGSSVKAAKAAFRKLAMEYHPDRNVGNEQAAEQKFKEIKVAFDLIKNGFKEEKRQPAPAPQKSPFKRPPPSPPEWAGWQSEPPEEQEAQKPKPKQKSAPTFIAGLKCTMDGRRIIETEQVGPRAFLARVSAPDAMLGFAAEVVINGICNCIDVPSGVPNNLQFVHALPDGDVIIQVLMRKANFNLIDYSHAKLEEDFVDGERRPVLRTGEVSQTIVMGTADRHRTFKLQSPDGSMVYVKPPSPAGGVSRVKGKGYYDWIPGLNRRRQMRSDMIVTFILNEFIYTNVEK